MKIFSTPVRSFNIEITNKCTLKCLECPRNDNPWVLKHLTDLPLDLIQRIFPLEHKAALEGVRVNLCGAYGDCIYHRQFHDVISYFKKLGMIVLVETNGSYKNDAFWQRTCDILGDEDSIIFSVDGLEDTNALYRVNARWADIERAMEICAPRIKVNWKFIVFRHNEHQIEQARKLAEELGVDSITFKKSARFREHDPLTPTDPEYVGIDTRNRRAINRLLESRVADSEFNKAVSIQPRCYSGKNVAITARGYLFPCTSCESRDQSSWFNANAEHFNLRRHSIDEIFNSEKWLELQQMWKDASGAPDVCVQYCGVHQQHVELHQQFVRPDRRNKPDDALTYHFNRQAQHAVKAAVEIIKPVFSTKAVDKPVDKH